MRVPVVHVGVVEVGVGRRLVEVRVAVASGLVVGFAAYGASLALFVVALRELGTARTGAYFSVAPFVGAGLGLALLRAPR